MEEQNAVTEDSPAVSAPETESAPAPESTDTRAIIEQAMDKAETKPEESAQSEPQAKEQEDSERSAPESSKRDPWKSWKKEAAAELSKLPKNVQDYIIERQEQFHKGIEQYKEHATFAKVIDKSISPYKDYLQQLGVTPEVAFPNLLKTEKTLRTGSPQEKIEMFQRLAHDYGIDLGQLASIPYDANLHQLKSQLEFTQSQLEASNRFRQSHEDAQIQDHITDFAQGREFFEDVRMLMADLLDRGLATDLDDAYAKAVRLDPSVFEKTQAKQQVELQKQQLSRADQAAKAAKAAAVSVKGSPVGVNTQAMPNSTEDAVRMAMRAHGLL